MKRSTAILWVLIICLIALAIRLFFSFQSPYTSYDSYNVLRQVDAIKTTGLPIYSDELSYSGRTNVFSPLYYYVLAFFGLFIPTQIMVKILPNIFMSLLVLVVFFISLYISKNRLVSVISAFFSAFIPILFFNTFNRAPAYSLVLPMVFLFIYFILRINEDLYARLAILLVVLLVFTHAFSFVLIPVLLFYLVLVKLQALDTNTREVEMAMFITFFIFWFNLILYKKAFLAHGASVIWQNIPFVLLTRYYVDLSLFQIIFFIGLVPLFFGVYSIYANFFKQKKRSISLIVSFIAFKANFIPGRIDGS